MGPGAGRYATPVDPENLNSTYGLICRRVPRGCEVLDVGCAGGGLALVLESALGCRVLGVDIDPDAVAEATARGLEARVADLSDGALTELVGDRRFDVVVLADVLEHLVEPAQLLRGAALVLRPQGRVLVSFPNVSHVDVALSLAQDEWRYRPAGILDSTHLRFFTVGRFQELAFACGYQVAGVERVTLPSLGTEVLDYGRGNQLADAELRAIEEVTQRGNPNSRVYQYVLELRPAEERQASVLDARGEPVGPAVDEGPSPGSRPVAQLDVIVRTMDGRLPLLKDALYSIAAQGYPEVRAVVTVHTSNPEYLAEVQGLLGRLQGLLKAEVVAVPRSGGLRAEPLNRGLERVEGEFLAFCDDDDILYPTFAERLIGHLRAHPELTVAYGTGQVVRGELTADGFLAISKEKQYGDPFDRARLFLENYIPINTYVVRVADLRRAGITFDETLPVYEDWVFLRELAARFEFAQVDQVVSEYRLWGEHSNAVPASQESTWQETRAAVLRHHAAQPVRVRAEELASLVEALKAERERIRELGEQLVRSSAETSDAKELTRRLLRSRSWRITRQLRRLLGSSLPEVPDDIR